MMKQRVFFLVFLATVIVGGRNTYSQITAAKVLKTYVAATGGKKLYEELKNWQIKVKVLGSAPSKTNDPTEKGSSIIEFKTDMIFDRKGRYSGKVEFLGQTVKVGSDSKVHWLHSESSGYQIVDPRTNRHAGDEFFDLDKILRPHESFESIRYLGLEMTKGQVCNEIKFVNQNGRVQLEYFAVDSGLLLKSQTTYRNRKVERIYSNYNKTEYGLVLPKKIEEYHDGIRVFIIDLLSFRANNKIESNLWSTPDEVQKLLLKKKGR